MKTEIIELIVKVKISYPDKSRKKEAIDTAKRCVLCTSIWGTVSAESKSAKVYNPNPRRRKNN